MPLVKHRDTLSDLIRKGGERKSNFKDERIKQSELLIRNFAIVNPEDGSIIRSDDEITPWLRFSSVFLYIVELWAVKVTRFIAIVLAFTIVLAETSGQQDDGLQRTVIVLDYICVTYYLLDGLAKLFSMLAYREIVLKHLFIKIGKLQYFRRSGVVDLGIAIATLIYIDKTDISRWLHLLRCASISLFYLEQLPQIDVLSSGISAGLTSTMYTWLLMTVTFLVYSASGVIFFRDNDPYHFGDMSAAMWTYFEMGTLDNWADVLNINYWGCEEYPAGYYVNGTANEIIQTEFGRFYLPICWKPKASPTSASLCFVSFILICGFILVSLTVAFVTTGINTRLHELQQEEDKEELKKELGSRKKITFPSRKGKKQKKGKKAKGADDSVSPSPMDPSPPLSDYSPSTSKNQMYVSNQSMSSDPSKEKPSRMAMRSLSSKPDLVSEVKDLELLRQLLKQVWKGDNNIVKEDELQQYSQRKGALIETPKILSMRNLRSPVKKTSNTSLERRLLRLGLTCRTWANDKNYNYFVYVVIIFAAVLELLSIEELIDTATNNIASILCQVVFTIDLIVKFLACAPKFKIFIYSGWNVFDLVLVVLLWIPIISVSSNSYFGKLLCFICLRVFSYFVYFMFVELLKVLRIIRVLKMLSFIEELNVIIKSISTSARCLGYVIMFMLVFFFHFGAAGVFLFSKNDPFHFEDIGRAMLSLFQVSTLDNWGDIARMNIYGCRYIGYDPQFCDLEDSKGYGWLAAWYFIIFVIVGVMVLVALFIGVIITSMELLHHSIHEEADMLKKVRAKQTEFNINDSTCNTLLEIFDMIDVCANGRLTLHELKPVLSMVSLGENQQYELFHKIDEDASGKIDFAEFCELIKLMGEAYSANNPTTPLKDNMTTVKILGRFGNRTRNLLSFYSPKKKGWDALASSAMAKQGVEQLGLHRTLNFTESQSSSGGGQKPTSFKRRHMLLAAARMESEKMEQAKAVAEEVTLLKAKSKDSHGEESNANADNKSPALTKDSCVTKEEPEEQAEIGSGLASVLKSKSRKASIAVKNEEIDTNNSDDVEKQNVTEEPTQIKDSSTSQKPDTSPASKDEVVLQDTPIVQKEERRYQPIPMLKNNKVVPVDIFSKNDSTAKSSPKMINRRTLGSPYSRRTAFMDNLSPEDASIAALYRFPSDDSAVSGKYKAKVSRINSPSIYDRFAKSRKYRSGPIDRTSVPPGQNQPCLFFDYTTDGCDDRLEGVDSHGPHHSSPFANETTDRPATRG